MNIIKNTFIVVSGISLMAISLSTFAWSVAGNPDGSNSYVVTTGNKKAGNQVIIHVKSKKAGKKLAKALNKADKQDKEASK